MMQAIIDKINQQRSEHLYLGASLAIFQKGRWQEWYIGEVAPEAPVEAGLVYDLASVSKVIGVGTVLIQLLADGTLELDQPLKSYYPGVADETVTIRQLLTHTSGIDPYIPNRDRLSARELRAAINHITVTTDKRFLYTDINFLLLGFMLEDLFGKSLDELFQERVFRPLGMAETSFGPRLGAVLTVNGRADGLVHDPKAQVLGVHAGSAGLFSTVADLERFCEHYLMADFGVDLLTNYGSPDKPRSLGWNLDGDWLDHTGYTGPFIMINRRRQQAVIFLTNRTYAYDDRPLWIAKRRELRDVIKQTLS
ncbi:serine hydrolase domain-containing protein [Streptococcus entericus]|uniref:serine hydrolase domain-containing protein n=1 Tax=Streptococcus entericus TaxID=155680 RepID=UPI000380162C|nr:serine hydrolase domain-containing protein [Streptococcus entericus]